MYRDRKTVNARVNQVTLQQHVLLMAKGMTTAGNSDPWDLWMVTEGNWSMSDSQWIVQPRDIPGFRT